MKHRLVFLMTAALVVALVGCNRSGSGILEAPMDPVDPVAVIVMDPPGRSRTGVPFVADGSGSTFDPRLS